MFHLFWHFVTSLIKTKIFSVFNAKVFIHSVFNRIRTTAIMRLHFGFQTILACLMLIATVILFTDFTGVGATTYIDYSQLRKGGGGGGGSVPRFALEFRNNLPQFNLLLGVHADQKIDAVAEAIVGRVQI